MAALAILTLVRTDDGQLIPFVDGKELDGCIGVQVISNTNASAVTLSFSLAEVDFTVETPERLDS